MPHSCRGERQSNALFGSKDMLSLRIGIDRG